MSDKKYWGSTDLIEWLVTNHGLKTAKAEEIARSLPTKMAQELKDGKQVTLFRLVHMTYKNEITKMKEPDKDGNTRYMHDRRLRFDVPEADAALCPTNRRVLVKK